MGRSLKKRKLKKVKRVKVARGTAPTKKSRKKTMKKWEWWLLGSAFVLAFLWLIFLAKSGSMTPKVEKTTPAAATTQTTK